MDSLFYFWLKIKFYTLEIKNYIEILITNFTNPRSGKKLSWLVRGNWFAELNGTIISSDGEDLCSVNDDAAINLVSAG